MFDLLIPPLVTIRRVPSLCESGGFHLGPPLSALRVAPLSFLALSPASVSAKREKGPTHPHGDTCAASVSAVGSDLKLAADKRKLDLFVMSKLLYLKYGGSGN